MAVDTMEFAIRWQFIDTALLARSVCSLQPSEIEPLKLRLISITGVAAVTSLSCALVWPGSGPADTYNVAEAGRCLYKWGDAYTSFSASASRFPHK